MLGCSRNDGSALFQGMRIAFNEGEFMDQLNAARSESKKSFNDESVLLEKFIQRPR